jgi:hypothetical protein
MTRTSLAALLLLAAALALPGCGLKKQHSCTATATYAGKSAAGTGQTADTAAQAQASARASLCTNYCQDQDPGVDGALRAARITPRDHAERVAAVHNPPVKAALDLCLAACSAALPVATVQYRCESSGLF